MAKKNKAQPRDEKRAAAEYYKLNTKAVEDLVSADEENSPPVPEEELRKYRSGPKFKLADWVKIVLIKGWFSGAVCFFVLWGLGIYVTNQLDQIVLLGFAWGMVTDLLVNNVLTFFEETPGANDRWKLVTLKGFWSMPLNILYGMVLIAAVVGSYHVINVVLMKLLGATELVLGVEPILFGVFATAWDSLFIGCKRLMRRIVRDAMDQSRRS